MKIKRKLQKYLEDFKEGRINILYGPRRVGKTTLVKEIFNNFPGKKRYFIGDDQRVKDVFTSNRLDYISDFVSDIELLIIDEAQKVNNIGSGLKLLIDSHPKIKIIVTGSASLSLANQVGEPLTGRKLEYLMLPISSEELKINHLTKYDIKQELETLLIYGSFPNIYVQKKKSDKQFFLEELVNSLLLKDILELERVKGSKILLDLLRMLAYQIGSEVSLTELANNLGVDYKTVGRYLDLFEKTFIIFNLRGYSRNLRKEIVKKSKYYFYDNGIRNALISNFNRCRVRNDNGMLWENFIISERIKYQKYSRKSCNNYFWRSWNKQEVDWIEERQGKLFAYEFKYNSGKKVRIPSTLRENYPETRFKVINPTNYLDWVL